VTPRKAEERLPVASLLGRLVALGAALGVADGLLLGLIGPVGEASTWAAAIHLGVLAGLASLLLAMVLAPLMLALRRFTFLVRHLSDALFSLLGLAGVATAGYVLIRQPSWFSFDLRLLVLAALLLLGLLLVRSSLGQPRPARIFAGPTLLAGLAVALLTGGLLMLQQPLAISTHDGLARSVSGSTLLRPLRHLADEDRDGAPRWLCSLDCDCDDHDPTRAPWALDLAGDGHDADCDDRDGPATRLLLEPVDLPERVLVFEPDELSEAPSAAPSPAPAAAPPPAPAAAPPPAPVAAPPPAPVAAPPPAPAAAPPPAASPAPAPAPPGAGSSLGAAGPSDQLLAACRRGLGREFGGARPARALAGAVGRWAPQPGAALVLPERHPLSSGCGPLRGCPLRDEPRPSAFLGSGAGSSSSLPGSRPGSGTLLAVHRPEVLA